MDTYLGLDFGGTKLLIGEVDSEGRILREKRYKTGCRQESKAVEVLMESLKDYVATVGFEGELKGAGVGIVGTVDYKTGRWIAMHPKATVDPIPLADMIKEVLGVPVWIDNDVKSATTAERVFGGGKESENFIYLNVGTGLAAGFVVDGRIVRGSRNDSGEIGHTVLDMRNEDNCICGRHGCVENAVSGYGFSRQAEIYGIKEELTAQGDLVSVAEIYERAKAGDETACKIVDYAAESLACLIMNLVKTLDPEMFILGGGCVQDGYLLGIVKEKLNADIMRTVTEGMLLSRLDPRYTGLLGAAALPIAAMRER